MLASDMWNTVIEVARKKSPDVSEIIKVTEVRGGCINRTFGLETNVGVYFVKVNSASAFPGMFEAEARGLEILAESGEIAVPAVIGFGESGALSFLVLEFVGSHKQKLDFWENFGKGLARLHKKRVEKFGLYHNNYIGSLRQDNHQEEEWEEFFITRRLIPQIASAKQAGLLQEKTEKRFEQLFRRLSDFFPKDNPSLLHGDLWGGNYMTGASGQAVLIDPAVYYGHRYMDLGMTKLFGGFSESFYDYYNEGFPLEKGWRQGLEVANLYPLLVHVNLFGGGYLSSINQTLQRFA